MSIYGIVIAFAALLSACGSSGLRDRSADRPTGRAAMLGISTAKIVTVEQLEAKLNACSAEAGCRVQPILEMLWARGYCRTSSHGPIGKCTAEEVAGDRSTTAEFGS